MNTHALSSKHYYEAIKAKDSRFDGVFFVGVKTTGVYCRPVCRVRTPLAQNCTYYTNAAAAEQAGFRPCLRCRPELAPGNSINDATKRLAQQAAMQIKSGALVDSSLEQLAQTFNVSDRQLRRAVESEFGVSPIALAQTYRLLLAKQLLTETPLKIIDVAFASGFASVRRFNDAFRKYYRLSPSDLRKNTKSKIQDCIELRLSYRPPLAWETLITFLSSRSGEGIVKVEGDCFSATLQIDDVDGWVSITQDAQRHCLNATISLSLLPCLTKVIAKLRQLFDLDANPNIIDAALIEDKTLRPLIKATPGLRIPGTLNGFELTLRAILGQQVTVKAASTLFQRFVIKFGESIDTPIDQLNRLAPTPKKIASARLQTLINLGLTQARAETIKAVAKYFCINDGLLESPSDIDEVKNKLLAIKGIGPWTADYIAMRCLSDPDALPAADLGILRALDLKHPKAVIERTNSWRPWRAYGVMHLWNSLSMGG